jgi:hypothetical protein
VKLQPHPALGVRDGLGIRDGTLVAPVVVIPASIKEQCQLDLLDRITRPKNRSRRLVGDARSAVARANAVLRRVGEPQAAQAGHDAMRQEGGATEGAVNEAGLTD